MNYPEALQYLNRVQEMGAKLSLDNIQSIIDNLPFDIGNIKFVQVAGTNGKGSTSHFIASILQAAGHKVGLFISPHLQDIRERISINKEWIPQEDFAGCLSQVRDISENLLNQGKIENMPTFFENIFLTAICYFHHQAVDYAVLEVGLGGRLDATSTITPLVSVITNISFDHTKTLGPRISDIAAEKAGIIKNGVPVICGCSVYSMANRVIRRHAQENGAPFANAFDARNRLETHSNNNHFECIYNTDSGQYHFDVYMKGEHQPRNAAVATRAIQYLNRQIPSPGIPLTAIQEGIAKNFVPARIETIATNPPVILDCSHNEESIKALKNYLDAEKRAKKSMTLVFGVLRDKKYRKMIPLLLPYAKNIILTEPISKRALAAEKLLQQVNRALTGSSSPTYPPINVEVKKRVDQAMQAAYSYKEDILVTGSLYLSGEIRNIINGGLKN